MYIYIYIKLRVYTAAMSDIYTIDAIQTKSSLTNNTYM